MCFLKCCWADSIYILHHGPVAVTQMKSFNQSLATQTPTDYIPCAPSLSIHRMHRRKWQALLLSPVQIFSKVVFPQFRFFSIFNGMFFGAKLWVFRGKYCLHLQGSPCNLEEVVIKFFENVGNCLWNWRSSQPENHKLNIKHHDNLIPHTECFRVLFKLAPCWSI